jgi:hypothetical protein
LQNYVDLFESNSILELSENTPAAQTVGFGMGAGMAGSLASLLQGPSSSVSTSTGNSDSISFVDAFKELMSRAGQFGIHFIISLDNPDTIRIIKSELYSFTYKVFTKGISSTAISEAVGEMKNNAIRRNITNLLNDIRKSKNEDRCHASILAPKQTAIVVPIQKHEFVSYMWNWFKVFSKPNVPRTIPYALW